MADSPPEYEQTVVIDGVGLIGGSIASAMRQRSPATRILGLGRNPDRLQQAADLGLLDGFAGEVAGLNLQDSALAVSCLPVAFVADSVVRLSNALPAGSVVTDAGSIKERICDAVAGRLQDGVPFVPAHPIAGREQSGFEAALPDLFEESICILTANGGVEAAAIDRVEQFWSSLGCHVVRTSASEHDRALAIVSHLPHVAAAALTGIARPSETDLSGTGFRDSTRIAAGSPELWRQILMNNQKQVGDAIDQLITQLGAYRDAILSGDDRRVLDLLRDAAEARARLNDSAAQRR